MYRFYNFLSQASILLNKDPEDMSTMRNAGSFLSNVSYPFSQGPYVSLPRRCFTSTNVHHHPCTTLPPAAVLRHKKGT